MSKQNINVERLEVRLKGVSPEFARSAVDGMGHELLGQLSTLRSLSNGKQPNRIDRLDSGVSQIAAGAPPLELRSKIVERIAASIRSKFGRGED